MWIMRFSQKIFMEMKDMKKVISLLAALVLCFTMACSVAASAFVPSISFRDNALLVSVKDNYGKAAYGVLRDADGNIVGYIYDCLLVASIAEALDFKYNMPEDLRTNLIDVYNALNDGSMKLPYEKLDTKLEPDEIVVRELVEACFVCKEHAELLAQEGVTVDIVFDIGIDEDASVFVMSYINEEWDTIVEVVNNGDGTVTCTFEDLCPIALCVAETQPEVPSWVSRVWDILTNWVTKFFK